VPKPKPKPKPKLKPPEARPAVPVGPRARAGVAGMEGGVGGAPGGGTGSGQGGMADGTGKGTRDALGAYKSMVRRRPEQNKKYPPVSVHG
jgi:hypothetical protein